MKRNVYRILGCFLFAFTLCIMTPSFAKASIKNIPQTKTSGTYAGNVDLTGDENADSVIIRTTPDQEGWYIITLSTIFVWFTSYFGWVDGAFQMLSEDQMSTAFWLTSARASAGSSLRLAGVTGRQRLPL